MKWPLSPRYMLLVLALLASACGGAAATPEPVEITIEMTEYAFTPANLELRVGQEVTIRLVNKGLLEHEVLFGRQLMSRNNRPAGYQVDMFETAGVEPQVEKPEEDHEHEVEEAHAEEHTGFMVTVPGENHEATMRFTVTQEMVGEWEIGCFLQDGVHYDAGMKGTLVVNP